ncbi:MAG: cytidine deaminase [Lachnospiraceae bacterium]|nr:cytidine deaminase [Lachnospiraceae bacterium]
MEDRELLKLAREASKMSYSPYSKVCVGAALVAKSGKIYTGCNVENSSYGGTICAERTAALKAISEGDREFVSIAVAGSINNLVPCGMCRQFLAEFCTDMKVIYEDEQGEMVVTSLSVLFPSGFSLK